MSTHNNSHHSDVMNKDVFSIEDGRHADLTYDNSGYPPAHSTQPLMKPDGEFQEESRRRHKQTIFTQGCTIFLIVLTFVLLIIVIAVSSATLERVKKQKTATTVTTVYTSIGLPGYEGFAWEDVVAAAGGSSVRLYHYDAPVYNEWLDLWLSPMLDQLYNIELVRVPIQDTSDAVDLVTSQIAAGYGMNNGSVDMIWINGQNFANLKNSGHAYGPWANKVPNAANFDFSDPSIAFDFGVATSGLEIPYNLAQVVFIANEAYVNTSRINTIESFLTYITTTGANKFTYAAPCNTVDSTGACTDGDYTGSVFIRHIFYTYINYLDFLGSFDENLYLRYAPTFYTRLRSLENSLYTDPTFGGNNNNYPESNDDVDDLITQGKVYATIAYDPGHATALIDNGVWPSSVTGFVLTSGTISNVNYLAIPVNAAHKLAAVVTGDFIASAQAMFSRTQPENLGTLQAYDSSSATFTTGGWNVAFSYIDQAPTTPSKEELDKYRVPELSNSYIVRIEQDWYKCVYKYVPGQYSYCG